MKKKLIERLDNFYRIAGSRSIPFPLYIMIKDDIFFLGTSIDQFRSIAANKFTAKVPREYRRHIQKNQVAFYAGISKAARSLDPADFNSENQFLKTRSLLSRSPDMYMTAEKFKGNSSSGSVVIKTPPGYTSGLTYLLNLGEEFK